MRWPTVGSDPTLLHVGRFFTTDYLFLIGGRVEDATHFVYQVFGPGSGGPVYVGISNRFSSRWTSHRSASQWLRNTEVRSVFLEGYAERYSARLAEAALIAEHNPRFNTKPESKYRRLVQITGHPRPLLLAQLKPKERPGALVQNR